jgi:exopolysaccharide biosynthesis protein
MMSTRTKLALLLIALMGALLSAPANAIHLQDVYDQAVAGEGYDKLVVLDPGEVYSGYMVVTPRTTCVLHGNGALIVLDATGYISAPSQAKLDIDGCVITGGAFGLNYDWSSNSTVKNCTIVGNDVGIRCWGGQVTITNCIIAHSAQYGIACLDYSPPVISYNCMWANDGGDCMEFCPT